LGITAIAHGLYDFFALNALVVAMFIIYGLCVFGLIIFLSFKAIRINKRNSPFKDT
jgi:hypothetical protein